jgi:hypothetical protein
LATIGALRRVRRTPSALRRRGPARGPPPVAVSRDRVRPASTEASRTSAERLKELDNDALAHLHRRQAPQLSGTAWWAIGGSGKRTIAGVAGTGAPFRASGWQLHYQ